MAYTKLGRIRPVYSGKWSSGKAYAALEIVQDTDGGMSYIARKDVPAGEALTNSEYWAVVLDVREVLEAAENAVDRVNAVMDVKANALAASVTGNPARFNPDEHSVIKPVLTFEPIQDGSGDPYPAGGGKNLVDAIQASTTRNGLEITRNEDGSYTLNGTCTAAGVCVISELTLDAGTYTLSYETIDGSAPDTDFTVAQLWDTNADAALIYVRATSKKTASYTLTETKDVKVRLYLANGVTYTNLRVGIQLEKGSAATEYAPSVNIRAITGRTSTKLTRCGKNLLDLSKCAASSNCEIELDGDSLRVYSTADSIYRGAYLPSMILRAGVTYTLSAKVTDKVGEEARIGFRSTYAVDGLNANQFISAATLRDASSNANLAVGATEASGDATFADIQLEVNSDATTYEAYQGDDFSMSLGQTVYGGELNWNTGELAVNWALMTLDGTEGWYSRAASGTRYRAQIEKYNIGYLPPVDNTVAADAICSHYPSKSGNNTYDGVLGFSLERTRAHLSFYDPLRTVQDISVWETYLAEQYAAGTPVQICYELANPTTVQLTPAQITALSGINTLYGDSDEMVVHYNKSLNAAFEELKNAILAMGGNV